MTTPSVKYPSQQSLDLLSRLLFHDREPQYVRATKAELKAQVLKMTRPEFDDVLDLAQLNHVVIRGLEVVRELAREEGDATRAGWAESALARERARIANAISFLSKICSAFEKSGYRVAVIKSLDHWPDLGSDLDLYSSATPDEVCTLMKQRFGAHVEPRSWGDRLACKWNFMISGLPEAVEVHVGRLGQTGEQVEIAASVLRRARQMDAGGLEFRVPGISERLMISTLQRMYRHFYFRLCDMVDSTELADTGAIDYVDLRSAAMAAGIWKGTATYLRIVSDYAKSYRGKGLDLPQFVMDEAQFGGSEVYYARGFIRVPIMPQSARLFTSQLVGVFSKGELQSGVRLSLLPWLATAAMVGQKLTGSDKGIW
jgi:hypothetical protein